jgi:hypothetical protein
MEVEVDAFCLIHSIHIYILHVVQFDAIRSVDISVAVPQPFTRPPTMLLAIPNIS